MGRDPYRSERGWVAGNGVIEHVAQSWTVDGFVADAEADDSADEHIDDHRDPMAAKGDRLAAKQIHAPEAVFGLREESEPGGIRGTRMMGVVVRREDSTYDVLVDLHADSVAGLRIAASFVTRRGRTNSVVNPSANRSIVVRGRARRRERWLMISWCVSDKDSAMTERTPPERASLARVTIDWNTRKAKPPVVEPSYQGCRSAQD